MLLDDVTKRDNSSPLQAVRAAKKGENKPQIALGAEGVFGGWCPPGADMLHCVSVQLIGEEEDVSVYDIADHPDFRFRTTDIVIRIGNSDGATAKEDEVSPGHSAVTTLSPDIGGDTWKS